MEEEKPKLLSRISKYDQKVNHSKSNFKNKKSKLVRKRQKQNSSKILKDPILKTKLSNEFKNIQLNSLRSNFSPKLTLQCIQHRLNLTHFCDSCDELVCMNCIQQGPHNN